MSVKETLIAKSDVAAWLAGLDPALSIHSAVSADGCRLVHTGLPTAAPPRPYEITLDAARTMLHGLLASAQAGDRWGLTVDAGGLSLGRIKAGVSPQGVRIIGS